MVDPWEQLHGQSGAGKDRCLIHGIQFKCHLGKMARNNLFFPPVFFFPIIVLKMLCLIGG